MIITKSVELDRYGMRELFNAMISFSFGLNGRLSKEQFYSAYILQQIYKKLRTRENRMLDTGKHKIKIKLDSIQALVLADVLQNYPASMPLNSLLMELGSILPPLKVKP